MIYNFRIEFSILDPCVFVGGLLLQVIKTFDHTKVSWRYDVDCHRLQQNRLYPSCLFYGTCPPLEPLPAKDPEKISGQLNESLILLESTSCGTNQPIILNKLENTLQIKFSKHMFT